MNFLVQQIFTGKPKTVGDKKAVSPMEREWKSGIFKEAVSGEIWVGRTNLEGDGQADLKNHGGPEKAVFAYPVEHYSFFHQEYGLTAMQAGGMGENLSLLNMLERDVCIGDTYEIGGALIQVSQPRQPCWKPARRFKRKDLSLLIQNSGRTGWYFRVLQEGFIHSGQTLTLVNRPAPEWTIANCNHVMHVNKEDIEQAVALAACEWLPINWKNTLNKRVQLGNSGNPAKRLYGPNEE
ncbi:MOSC domain-containing protein [Bacillus sp. OxB-1]|uniref:MOSC domain-containing protein n=1 Tax=Bacillus sp. (strain OxB-1) TaxID=98228 RepID=UPI000597568A|nr:MOSC domain-containing protein [Bacillus sp. OxB-1]